MNNFKYLLSNSRKFHHPEVAEILYKHNKLTKLVCGSPLFKLKDYSLPKELIDTSYLINALRYLIPNTSKTKFVHDYLNILNVKNIDRHASKYIYKTDVYIGLSKTGLETGKLIKKHNKIYVCERSSSHIIFQNEILSEEYNHLGLNYTPINSWFVERELEEYDNADIILVPSNFVENTFLKYNIRKSRVINFGSYLNNFYPIKNFNKIDNDFNILFVGQLSIRKGLHYLIEAFNKFKHPSKKLYIIGPETEDKFFFRNLINKSLENNIFYLGTKTHKEINVFLNKSNVFVLPSIEEGMATVTLQAISAGCPVIVSENTGALEIVKKNKCGFVVPIRNSEIIKDKLSEIVDNKNLEKEFAANALKFSNEYTWYDYVKKLDNIIEKFKNKI